MEFVVEPWHWFVLGILLILSELILPAFAALWFGIAAVMVCILLWLFPMMGFTTQVVTWGILSILCTILWFKFIKSFNTFFHVFSFFKHGFIITVGTPMSKSSYCIFHFLNLLFLIQILF